MQLSKNEHCRRLEQIRPGDAAAVMVMIDDNSTQKPFYLQMPDTAGGIQHILCLSGLYLSPRDTRQKAIRRMVGIIRRRFNLTEYSQPFSFPTLGAAFLLPEQPDRGKPSPSVRLCAGRMCSNRKGSNDHERENPTGTLNAGSKSRGV